MVEVEDRGPQFGRLASLGPLRPWLEEPGRSLLPKARWPARFRKARVRNSDSEWVPFSAGLHKHGIVDFLADDEPIELCIKYFQDALTICIGGAREKEGERSAAPRSDI